MNILSELVKIPSVSGNEDLIQKFILSYLKRYSFETELVNGNVVSYIKGANSRKAIIFNGHVDTVPATNISEWEGSPFSGRVVGDKIYGRGASDMKGAVASMLLLADKLSVKMPECDVFLMFVNSEETDGSGTKSCLKWYLEHHKSKYEQEAVIIGEPTGLESFVYGHKGNIFVKATTIGDTGHGSKPEQIYKHAILEMYKVVKKMKDLEKEWKDKYKHEVLGSPTVGFTAIQAGNMEAPNIFAPTCDAAFDVRTTPEAHQYLFKEIKDRIPEAKFEIVYDPFPSAYTPIGSEICRVVTKVAGVEGKVVGWATDMCHFSEKGIPGVIIGPGEESQLHATNEYCLVSKVERCAQLYARIVEEYANT